MEHGPEKRAGPLRHAWPSTSTVEWTPDPASRLLQNVRVADRFFPLFHLPGLWMLLLCRPGNEVSSRLDGDLRPSPATEAQVPADGDFKGMLGALGQLSL